MDTNGVTKKYKIKIKNPVMAVPITFLNSYCPSQFTIIDGAARYLIFDTFKVNENIKQFRKEATDVNGVSKYFRVLIKKLS